jgi:hypothetical protein
MNTATTGRKLRILTGITAAVLTGTGLIGAAPAVADQGIGDGGATTRTLAMDIDDTVAARKVEAAADLARR